MSRALSVLLASLGLCLHAEETSDLLRFSNGDQLHGRFEGISEGPSLNWHRDDLNDSVAFGIENLRHLVLRGGNPVQPLESISLVELINGDQIPGVLSALDEQQVTVETSCAGTLTFERDKVSRIAPQPLGGRLHYHGPFSPDRWDIVSYRAEQEQQADETKDEEEKDEEQEVQPDWRHSGAAWYWSGKTPGTALILKDILPRRSTLRFDLAWKSNLNFSIVVHADFQTEKPADEKPEAAAEAKPANQPVPAPNNLRARQQFVAHDTDSLPRIFGNAFVLQIHSNYMVIYRTIVDNEGNRSVKRIQTASNRMRLGENSKSSFELRSDLDSGNFSLFVNGEFITQWSDPALKNDAVAALDGSSLAFMPQIADGQAKLSDVIIAEWNGMPDSARSLQVKHQDIVLMTNGLDRLSGKALALEAGGQLLFRGKHGEFRLPLEDVAELRFARDGLAEPKEPSGQTLKIRFSPMGHVSGIPISGDRKTMLLRSPVAGEITIHNDSAVMFEFDDSNEIFTDWDANF